MRVRKRARFNKEKITTFSFNIAVVITFHISSSFSLASRSKNITASLGCVHSDVISSIVDFLGHSTIRADVLNFRINSGHVVWLMK